MKLSEVRSEEKFFTLPFQHEVKISFLSLFLIPQSNWIHARFNQTIPPRENVYSILLVFQGENLGCKCALNLVFKQLILFLRNKK